MNIVIPLAGRGSRFIAEAHKNPEYAKPKPLINIAGIPMVKWATESFPLTQEDKLILIVLKEHIDKHQIDEKLKVIYGEQAVIITVDKVTEGAACTALLAKEYINNEEELIVMDSDQYIDGITLFKEIRKYKGEISGMIPVFYANNPKWSFASIDEEGNVIEVAEKVQISRNANIGAYYFAKGRFFVTAAEEMIAENDRTNGEFYLAPCYNYLIRRGKRIRLCRPKFVHGLGIPKDVDDFIQLLRKGEVDIRFPIKL